MSEFEQLPTTRAVRLLYLLANSFSDDSLVKLSFEERLLYFLISLSIFA